MTHISLNPSAIPARAVAGRLRLSAVLCGPISLVVAPLALGMAIQINFGQYHPLALRWLSLSLIACLAGFLSVGRKSPALVAPKDNRVLVVAIGAALALQFFALLTSAPASHAIRRESELYPFYSCIALAAICSAIALLSGRCRRHALVALLVLHFTAGLCVLTVRPPPPVDVCIFQRDACRALLHGQNPYTLTFPVPYTDPARVYAPGTFAGGRLLFGYPYPPLSLLLVLPGYLFGDFRYAHLLATTLAGAFIALSRPGRIATGAAALFLFTPRGFFVLEAGWTEPLAVLLLSMVVFAACRGWRIWPILFGLLLVTKQYLILALPLMWLLRRSMKQESEDLDHAPQPPRQRSAVRTLQRWISSSPVAEKIGKRNAIILLATVLVPALVTLPLILWNVPAFIRSAVVLQFHQPMRMDALSFAPWFVAHFGWHLPMWLPFLAAGGAVVLVLRQRSRTPAAFTAGFALVFFLFFALNKQAFCNYYFLVIGAMCCAIATSGGNVKPSADSYPETDPACQPRMP